MSPRQFPLEKGSEDPSSDRRKPGHWVPGGFTTALSTTSCRDVARDTSCQDVWHILEQSSDCSKPYTSTLDGCKQPELHYGDITGPISMIFPRVDLEKLFEMEERVWRSSGLLNASVDALCQMSCSAHENTVQILVDKGRLNPSSNRYIMNFVPILEHKILRTREGAVPLSAWIRRRASPSSHAHSINKILRSRKQEVRVMPTMTTKSTMVEMSRPSSVEHANNKEPRRQIELSCRLKTTTKSRKFEGEEAPPLITSSCGPKTTTKSQPCDGKEPSHCTRDSGERKEIESCRESTTTYQMGSLDDDGHRRPTVTCCEVKLTIKSERLEEDEPPPCPKSSWERKEVASRRESMMVRNHVDNSCHSTVQHHVATTTTDSKPGITTPPPAIEVGDLDDNSHCRPITKCREIKLTTKSQKFEGEEAPPLITLSCRESAGSEKDERSRPSQIKTTRADCSSWWRSGWLPAIQGPYTPLLRRSHFGSSWNQERRQLSLQHNAHNRAYHSKNDEHRHSPSNNHGGDIHHEDKKRRRRKQRRHHHYQKKDKARHKDIPQLDADVHLSNEHLDIDIKHEMVVSKQPSERQRYGPLCHACTKLVQDLAQQQGQLADNGGRPIVIHLTSRQSRRHRKKRMPTENRLQEASCKQ